MLASVMVCALGAALISTIALLAGPHRVDGRRRSPYGVIVSLAFSAVGVGVLPALGASAGRSWSAAAVCVVASALWLPRTARWRSMAHVMWASSVTTGVCFLVYTALWTATSHLGLAGTIGGALLWLLEFGAFMLSVAYLWEMIDAVGTRRWDRRRYTDGDAPAATRPLPFVSIHVPAHNEPPDMLIDTLKSLLALDYPSYEVHLIDNNTDDEELWRPVERFCSAHSAVLQFHHLAPWPGYKSGALNYALTVTDARTEIIAVVDADYVVDPGWLATIVPMFEDPSLAFVQTPQDYREWEGSRYFTRLYHSYDYFFRVSQRSRDERNAAIFGGTMGLLRKAALEQVGGWDEWCITEDAELSLRLNAAGWSGRQVDRSFGRGIMPLTFESLKGQRFRWCFGGIQILRMHWRLLMPWSRDPDNRLTNSQRLAYLSGAMQWFGDLSGLAFLVFLGVGALDLVFGGGIVLRRMSPLLLFVVPALSTLAFVRAIAIVRTAGHGSWRDAVGALGIWLGLGLTVARACVRGATEREGVFLRTPKTKGDASLASAMLANRSETGLAASALVLASLVPFYSATASSLIISAMLVVAGVGHLAAPLNSFAALHADLPERLRRRRRTERARAWARIGAQHGSRIALGAAAVGLSTLTVLVLAPETARDSTPPLSDRPGVTSLLGGAGARKATSTTPRPKPSLSTSTSTTNTTVPSASATQQGASTSPSATATSATSGTAATTSPLPSSTTSAGGPGNSTVTPSNTNVPTTQPTQASTSRGRPSSTPTTSPRGKPTTTPSHR